MKLNKTRTLIVGLAFFTISTFWMLYNNSIPLILKETFDLNEVLAGFIMSVDNILALFMLPLFGMLSDKTSSRIGKRMPYILIGTILSVVLMMLLIVFDTPSTLVPFIVILGILLIAMSIYRSPAVALMPDVTPKPLLSKGNAVINLMGAAGGIIALIFIAILSPGEGETNFALFGAVAAVMLVGVAILFFTFDENKARKEKEDNFPDETNLVKESGEPKAVMSKSKRNSLILILASIFLWFFGYNAIVSAYSKYAVIEWGLTEGMYAHALIIAQVAAIIAFIPIGFIATKIGRKRTIITGIITLTIAFGSVGFFKEWNNIILAMFVLAGFGWAAINVNSYPMVVSLSKGSDIGKYTGYYYTASMASQIVTPIVSGALLEYVGYWTLFPYAALFVILSAVTMIFVKHGDSRPAKLKNKIEAFDVED